jgi:hypothetical protein
MVLAATIPWGLLPPWMYHAQNPPPTHALNTPFPASPGSTWFFRFSSLQWGPPFPWPGFLRGVVYTLLLALMVRFFTPPPDLLANVRAKPPARAQGAKQARQRDFPAKKKNPLVFSPQMLFLGP